MFNFDTRSDRCLIVPLNKVSMTTMSRFIHAHYWTQLDHVGSADSLVL